MPSRVLTWRVFLAITAWVLLAVLMPLPGVAAAQAPDGVVVSEIHYHPQAVGSAYPDYDDREDTEFVELTNVGSTAVDIGGWCFDRGVQYCFAPGTTIDAAEVVVLARNATDFAAVAGFAPDAVYAGRLSNSGERLRLVNASAVTMVDVEWQTVNPWPVSADGDGPSLELIATGGSIGDPANWAVSADVDGNPGVPPTLASSSPPLVLSHVGAEIVPAGTAVTVQATAANTSSMMLEYNVDYGAIEQLAMTPSAAPGTWAVTLPALAGGGFIRYRFVATGPGGTATNPRPEDSVDWWAVAVASPQPNDVAVLDLYFRPADWADVDANNCGCTGAIAYEGRVWTDVTMRRVGFTSINLPKGSFRLDFPDGHPFEASFLDGPADELTIDSGHPNHDLIREQVSWAAMEQLGFPPIRNTHVRVEVNGDFQGLYLLREEQDGDWRSRHDLDRGALYKVDSPTDSFGFSGLFTKKEGLDEPDTDLIAFRSCLDETGAALRSCLLASADVPQLVNEIAAMAMIRQIDQREFNFFLYRDDTENGLWRLLPDDLDRTWGINGTGEIATPNDSSLMSYQRCVGLSSVPANEICRALLRWPEFEAMYNRRLRTLADEVLSDPIWHDRIASAATLIAADWADDDARWNRTGHSFSTIVDALDGWVDDYVVHLRSGGHDGLVPAQQSAQPAVTISDYRPDPGDGLGYVMITNPSASESIDLSGWAFAGRASLPNGLVVLPGATVVISTADDAFQTLQPGFTGIRAHTNGTLAGELTLVRRDGSIAATAGAPASNPLVLNEWNGVSPSSFIAGGDATLGNVVGNGGDWFELVVVQDRLDVRGWRLVISDAETGASQIRDTLVFANDPLLAELEAGTIITVSEDRPDDVSFSQAIGDWHLNFQANDADAGRYFTPASQENFGTNHDNWQLSIVDDAGMVMFGPAGEGVGALSGLNSAEIGELGADPSSAVDVMTDYDDGDSSTYGLPNTRSGLPQDFSSLRAAYVRGDLNCDGRYSIVDAILITQYVVAAVGDNGRCPVGVTPSTAVFAAGGDVNGDGATTVVDALLVTQCLVGRVNVLCAESP